MLRFVIAICALVIAGHAKAEPLDHQAFTRAFAAAAAAAMPTAKVTVSGDLQLETRSAAGERTATDLRNAYQAYLSDPAQIDVVIRRYVAVLAETARIGDHPTLDPRRIVPVLKSVKWLEGLGNLANKPLTEPFNNELVIVYAEDREHLVRFLTTRDDVGDRSKLRNLALGNLHRLLAHIEMRPGADGLWLISADGQYESSLLLADDVWSSGEIKVDGDIVVAVPAKDELIVTGSRNHAGIAQLRAIAAVLARTPYGLTPSLFVYRDGKFVEFTGN